MFIGQQPTLYPTDMSSPGGGGLCLSSQGRPKMRGVWGDWKTNRQIVSVWRAPVRSVKSSVVKWIWPEPSGLPSSTATARWDSQGTRGILWVLANSASMKFPAGEWRTSMSKKGPQRLVWTPTAISAFQELRERFTTAPILHHPDPELEFIVEVDASSTGIGAVLSQRQGDPHKAYPCAFYSRKLNPTEQNYDVGNRELLAMKAAFEEWRHWLEGAKHPFTVLTNHRNLEYLRSAKRLNHRQARWALFFTRFDFTVTYRPGSLNTKADALSRQYESSILPATKESIISPALIVAPIQWDIMTEISEAQVTDPPPAKSPPNLTYVPHTLCHRVIQLVHSTPA